MDSLDMKIIDVLRRDGRASNAGIARDAGVSEGTVRRRLKRLVDEEFIRVMALPDPGKMGYESQALVGVHVDPDKIDAVANGLEELEEVSWVAVTTGSFDIFVWVTLPSSNALGVFLRTKLGVVPGVRRTETFVYLALRKRGNTVLV